MREAGQADKTRIVPMLARAFADDPAMRWIIPDPADRARRLPRLFALLYDNDATGLRLTTAEGEAATLWRAPGKVHIGWPTLLRQAVPLLWALGPSLRRALRVSDAIDAHMPSGDFWYLHVAGCDPAHQGRGLGAAVVREGVARVAGPVPTYLETATERNLGFYQTLGFAVTHEWTVPGGGPRFWSMLRPPD